VLRSILPEPPVVTADQIDAAVAAQRGGAAVAFPTETVYGLGADAANPAAVARVFRLKGRPQDHPLIVHIGELAQLRDWAAQVPPVAMQLAARFWPGPLTLILPKAARVNTVVTGGQDSIGIRIPAHPIAQRLLAAFGGGIAAPSANRYGRLSATRAAHVREEFGDAVPVVLDGGEATIGIESTIISCLGNVARLLRPGRITRSQVEREVGPLPEAEGAAPRASGDRQQHYAPATPVRLVAREDLLPLALRMVAAGDAVGVLAMYAAPAPVGRLTWIDAGVDPAAYAHQLYDQLRNLDRSCGRVILVEAPPASEDWGAVRDRLARASAAGDARLPP
jgi:L-threonylcarbamoyladenylate synthase